MTPPGSAPTAPERAPAPERATARGSRGDAVPVGPGLFLVSVAVLALQVLQTRILSVQMWHHHSYMVVTMTLLGFGVAGSLVTVVPSLAGRYLRRSLAWSGTLFALSTIVCYLVLSVTADAAAEMTARGSYLQLSIFYSYLLFPYFFGGLVVTCALTAARSIPRLYFVNLLGSAVGAWVFIAAITPLGGERLLVLCAATGPLAALTFLRRPAGGERLGAPKLGAWGALAACALLFVQARDWLAVGVASTKAETFLLEERASSAGARLLESRWTPLCRLDVVKLPEPGGVPTPINIFQDGDAITVMHSDASWEHVPKAGLNTLAYVPHSMRAARDGAPGPKALAVGIGGGIDLRFALEHGASSVLGIEINGTTVELVGEDYADFNGGIYDREGVEVVVGEGRSTLRRLDERFDLIQLSGTDTYTAGTSGAYVLSESYLYTSGALEEYFDHLTEEGTLGMIRLAFDPPRENLRLFAIALEELRRRGVEQPSRHAVVVYQETPDPEAGILVRFAGCVFSMSPLSQESIEVYRLADGVETFRVAYHPGMETDNPFTRLAAAIDAGTEDEFYADYPWDVRPVGDDSPFFFNFHHWSSLWEEPVEVAGEFATEPVAATLAGDAGAPSTRLNEEWYELTGGPIGLRILGSLLVQTTLLVAALVILPLVVLRRTGLRAPHASRHLLYFLALGAGFMFLEISTIQRLVLFLGHPTYSLTVTLCCFLFFAGLGSLFAARFGDRGGRVLRPIVLGLAVLIGALAVALESVLDALLWLPLPGRIAVAVALLAPMNFLMGMPFPLGLARLRRLAPQLVPWALGANGGASVVGSILCIVVAMESGFRSVSLFALALYVVGTWVVTSGPLAPVRTEG